MREPTGRVEFYIIEFGHIAEQNDEICDGSKLDFLLLCSFSQYIFAKQD